MTVSAAVQAMVDDPQAETAPLNDFIEAMREDDNLWWRIGCGHHLNLFQEAVDKMDPLHVRYPEEDEEEDGQPICSGGIAEPVTDTASRCPRCGYTFTTVARDPTAVPPHWVVTR